MDAQGSDDDDSGMVIALHLFDSKGCPEVAPAARGGVSWASSPRFH